MHTCDACAPKSLIQLCAPSPTTWVSRLEKGVHMQEGPEADKNLALWTSVQTIDPAMTKQFVRPGGFAGTAVVPIEVVRMATAQFGPCGLGWGVEILEEHYKEGAPIPCEGDQVVREVIHILRVQLWYKVNGEVGKIVQYGQTPFVVRTNQGPLTDEEAPKKSLTDATIKCLSLLGFAADVFAGMYDDSKYVNDLRLQYGGGDQPGSEGVQQQQRFSERYAEYKSKIQSGKMVDVSLARRTIQQDKDLSAMERSMLLAMKEMKPAVGDANFI